MNHRSHIPVTRVKKSFTKNNPSFPSSFSNHQWKFSSAVKFLFHCLAVLSTIFLIASIRAVLRLQSNPLHSFLNDGKAGILVHDPYVLLRFPPPFTVTNTTCSVPPGTGEEGPAGIRALYKIYSFLNDSPSHPKKKSPKIRLFCMVYTHSNRHDIVRAIAETYGQECDGFMAASNLTEESIGAFRLEHDGSETYQNIWNKVQKMWFYVYTHYLLDFDWFLICGDDTFVIPANARALAAHYDANEVDKQKRSKRSYKQQKSVLGQPPMYLGASIPHSSMPQRRYCGGGAGYMLNRAAVFLLNRRIHMGECPDAVAPDEDIRVARCLDDAGVRCQDTNDESEQVRFHHLDAQFHASWTPNRPALWLWPKLQYFHGIRGNQSQLEQISNTSVTFHLDKSKMRSRERDRGMRRYHAILHPELCGPDFAARIESAATCASDERSVLRKKWEEVDVTAVTQ
jgi:glycoprotein-N-acetylgalactosamine 3-beta-galactosyltransferase